MTHKVLILGGYGVFGKRIARALADDVQTSLIIAGRNAQAAETFANELDAKSAEIDIQSNLDSKLKQLQPSIVINCCGPFQEKDFSVLEACMQQGCHYIDLADGRDYVGRFLEQDNAAKKAAIIAYTGASTVPAISSAMLDYMMESEFSEIHALEYGVTPGNQTERGVATVAAILSYVGKTFTTLINGKKELVIGWQGLKRVSYPKLGKRWMSYCDIPDLDLFPKHYPPLRTIRFYAGLELSILHVGLWLLSWPVRWKWLKSLQPFASLFRRISLWFYPLGSDAGGMHMYFDGLDKHGKLKALTWHLIARKGDGPQIPATPVVILVKKITSGKLIETGAYAAVGAITKEELMGEWRDLHIEELVNEPTL